MTGLQAVIADSVSKHQKSSFPFWPVFHRHQPCSDTMLHKGGLLALLLAFVIIIEDAGPFRHIINTILDLVKMDGFLSRSTTSPWKRSSIFARKLENGLISEFLLDFSTANRRVCWQRSCVGRGKQSSAQTITSSRTLTLIIVCTTLQMPSSFVMTYG